MLALSIAPAARAQQWLVNSVINNAIAERAICDSALKRHLSLPSICAKYPKYSGAKSRQGGASPTSVASATAPPTATRFTPVAGDDSVKQLADSLGNSPQERQQILQLAAAGSQLFAQKYKGRGWDNTLAGAMTFFIVSAHIVNTGEQPGADVENNLYTSLNASLAQSDIAKASDKDKTALYNVLLASAGLPLVFYVDGKQNNNTGQVEQAKAMAAGFGRKLFKMEPQELTGMLGAGASVPGTPVARAVASGGGQGVDGRYDCQMLSVRAGASFSVEYRPIGLWFTISGTTYSATGGGGKIVASADTVSFHGGAYDGWRGARINDAIVFRKDDHSNPRAGDGIRNGDIRCGHHG
ncbi:MAG: hypothetical protein JSS25_10215 [Proteobacteria bacterium]|nr:hypothetical protein [Pseudomonadota bacterium]